MKTPIFDLLINLFQFFLLEKKVQTNTYSTIKPMQKEEQDLSSFLLLKSLKQLEFISYLETQIENGKEDNYSLEFLQSIDLLKIESEQQTFNLISSSAA